MNTSSDNTESSPIIPHDETTDPLTENHDTTEKLELSARLMTRLSNISLSNSVIGGIVFLGLAATFFIFTKGTQICLWSDCPTLPPQLPVTGDFWAFAGGAATLMVLTALVGMPLLPAAAASIGVWLLMQRFH
jgi:hypothetical protein